MGMDPRPLQRAFHKSVAKGADAGRQETEEELKLWEEESCEKINQTNAYLQGKDLLLKAQAN